MLNFSIASVTLFVSLVLAATGSGQTKSDSAGRVWTLLPDGSVSVALKADEGDRVTLKVPSKNADGEPPMLRTADKSSLSSGEADVTVSEGPGLVDLHLTLTFGNEAKMLKHVGATAATASTFCGASGKRLDDDGLGNAYASVKLPKSDEAVLLWVQGGSADDRKAVLDSYCVK